MLEGQEISELMLSHVKKNNSTLRLDSEFFLKEYSSLLGLLNSKNNTKLDEITEWITQGPNPKFCEESPTNIPCLTGRNINKGRVNYLNSDFVNPTTYISLKKYQLKEGDTLITLKGKGSVGKIGYVTSEKKAIFSRDIGIIRPNKNINPGYLNAFILSKFGKKIISRGETGGTGQSTLTTTYLKNILVPRLAIEDTLGGLINLSEYKFNQAKSIYKKAENFLLTSFNINEINDERSKFNIKKYSSSYGKSGRLDAEYYQIKFEKLLKVVSGKPHDKLKNLAKIQKSIEPGSNVYTEKTDGIPFVRVSDFSEFGISEPTIHLSSTFVNKNHTKLTKLFPKKNCILFTKDGSVGQAFCIKEDSRFLTSSAILHLSVLEPEIILPEYLALVLNSPIVKLQAERDAGGSVILHWRASEIEQIVIPLADLTIQNKINDLITESFMLKRASEQLLEVVSNAIELAIEQSEGDAINYLNHIANNDLSTMESKDIILCSSSI